MKECKKCKTIKNEKDFYKCKANKDGLHGKCKDCLKSRSKKYYQENRDSVRKKQRKYQTENRDKMLELNRNYYNNNKNKFSKYGKKYYLENRERLLDYQSKYTLENKEKCSESRKNFYNKNPNYQKELTARRRAKKLNATLDGYETEIKNIYKDCPKDFSVDHIHPLQNDLVCGLHVPWNLQYLTKKDNLKKGNSFDGTVENIGWKNGKK